MTSEIETKADRDVASYADVLRLVTRSSPREGGEERVTSLRTSAWEANRDGDI